MPLDQATVGPGYVKVGFDQKLVKDAPSIDTDGELPAGDEEAIFRHYGLTYQQARRRAPPGPPLTRPPYRRIHDALFLLLVIAAIALGIVGVVAEGLLYLLIIGIVVFLAPSPWPPCGCDGAREAPSPVGIALHDNLAESAGLHRR